MSVQPQQLLLPLLFALDGEAALDRQEVVAERILELVREEQG
jgi:hypothetical protein